MDSLDFTSYEKTQVILVSTEPESSRILLVDEYPHYCLPTNHPRGFTDKDVVLGTPSKLCINCDEAVSKITLVDFPDYTYHLQLNGEVVASSKIIDGKIVFCDFSKSNNSRMKFYCNEHGELNMERIDNVYICLPHSFNYEGLLKVELTTSKGIIDTYVTCLGEVFMGFNHETDVIVMNFEAYGRDIDSKIKINGHVLWSGKIKADTNRIVLRLVDPCGKYYFNPYGHTSEIYSNTLNLSRVDRFSMIFDHRFTDGLKKIKIHQQFLTKYNFDGFIASNKIY